MLCRWKYVLDRSYEILRTDADFFSLGCKCEWVYINNYICCFFRENLISSLTSWHFGVVTATFMTFRHSMIWSPICTVWPEVARSYGSNSRTQSILYYVPDSLASFLSLMQFSKSLSMWSKRNRSDFIDWAAKDHLFTDEIPLLHDTETFACCVSTLGLYVSP